MPIGIRSEQIKDDTIRTEDIKNHTIRLEDLSQEVLNAMGGDGGNGGRINFSFTHIKDGESITINDGEQMSVLDHGTIVIDGELFIDGELYLLNL